MFLYQASVDPKMNSLKIESVDDSLVNAFLLIHLFFLKIES